MLHQIAGPMEQFVIKPIVPLHIEHGDSVV